MEAQQQQQYYYQSPGVLVPLGYMLVPKPGPDCTHPLLTWTTDVRHAYFKDERINNVIQLLRSLPMDMSVADLLERILSNDSIAPVAKGRFMKSERHINSILNAIAGDRNGRKILDAWLLKRTGYAMDVFRQAIDKEMESVKPGLAADTNNLTPEHFLDFDFDLHITGALKKKAPILNSFLVRAAQSDRAAKENTMKSPDFVSIFINYTTRNSVTKIYRFVRLSSLNYASAGLEILIYFNKIWASFYMQQEPQSIRMSLLRLVGFLRLIALSWKPIKFLPKNS